MSKAKIGMILILYSMAVTFILLLAGIILIKTSTPPSPDLPNFLFTTSDANMVEGVKEGYIKIQMATVIKSSNIGDYYMEELLRYFPLMMLCFLVVTAFGTWILWKTLLRQNDKQALFMANELRHIDEEDRYVNLHPAIGESFAHIKEKLDVYVSDYVKLCSYITHEQKNVLSLLRGKLQLAGQVELISEVDKVAGSIDDILTISAFKKTEYEELVDVALVCADVCDEYKKIYPNIYFDFDDEANTQIKSRTLWIYRAVCNLVVNAIKYGNHSDIHVVVENKKGSVIISVSDKGPGIDEKFQEKLFDNRYRISNIKKDGSGIGLNLVKHVCELCGGIIWLESEVNCGSTFYMVFPEALGGVHHNMR